MLWRYLLATVLSILVLVLFNHLNPPAPRPAPGQGGPPGQGADQDAPAGQGEPRARVDGRPRPADGVVRPGVVGPGLAAANTQLGCRFDPPGRLDALRTLSRHADGQSVERDLLRAAPGRPAPLSVTLLTSGGAGRPIVDWVAVEEPSPSRWRYRHITEEKLEVLLDVSVASLLEKRLGAGRAPSSRPRHLNVRLTVSNKSEWEIPFSYEISGPTGMRAERETGGDVRLAYGLLVASKGDDTKKTIETHSVLASAIGTAGWEGVDPSWIGVYNTHSLAALYAKPPPEGVALAVSSASAHKAEFVEIDGGRFGGVETSLKTRSRTLAAGASTEDRYGLFAGPRDSETLASYSDWNLGGANLTAVRISERFRLTFDSGRGGLLNWNLADFDRLPNTDERIDYSILRPAASGPSTLSVEIFDIGDEQRSLGFAATSWTLTESSDGPRGFPRVVLENERDGVRALLSVQAARADDVLTQSEEVRAAAAADPDGPHHVDVSLSIENRSGRERRLFYRIYGPSGIDSEDFRVPGADLVFGFGAWGSAGSLLYTEIDASDLPDDGWSRSEGVAWLGIKSSYFASLVIPRVAVGAQAKAPFVDSAFAQKVPDYDDIRTLAAKEKEESRSSLSVEELVERKYASYANDAYKNVRTGWSSVELVLAPQESRQHEYVYVATKRDKKIFEEYADFSVGQVNEYGFMGSLIGLFITLLETLKGVAFGSWGVAIVLLTFLVKLCLHPINKRSQRSMMRAQKKMQKVKPMMDEIKERLGHDKLASQREMQKLFREHNINPAQQLGGCLMIFLQLPIWIGLYRTLYYAVGLRQAQFLWMDDLTQPDHLVNFGVDLRFWVFDFTYFNLLPVLYVILTVINQRLQPKPTDPQMQSQYQMMTLMMVLFGFIFYGFPSGFMLYIMTSAALGIIESKMIKAQLKAEDDNQPETGVSAAYPSAPTKGGDSKGGGDSKSGKGPGYAVKRKKGKRKRR